MRPPNTENGYKPKSKPLKQTQSGSLEEKPKLQDKEKNSETTDVTLPSCLSNH